MEKQLHQDSKFRRETTLPLDTNIDQVKAELSKEKPSAVQLLELLLSQANSLCVSDIHIVNGIEILLVRFRKNGDLFDAYSLQRTIGSELIARIKVLAGLRIDEHQLPQDGRFTVLPKFISTPMDVRVSVLPSYFGDTIVLRLLSSEQSTFSLEEVGMLPDQEALVRKCIRNKGLILITGPTGSGKTSTLCSLLQVLNKRTHSIITIEDPIEYVLPGITQLQASRNAGLTFAEGVRGILRQDPNILGIGEIRDSETAELSIHAALTGHTVLTTLHSSSAPRALHRLLQMGIEPYLLASTVSLIINQRLVKRICHLCSTVRPFTAVTELLLENITHDKSLYPEKYSIANGCSTCEGTGILGRIALFEILVLNSGIQEALQSSMGIYQLEAISREQGMHTLLGDAFEKTALGLFSLTELVHTFA